MPAACAGARPPTWSCSTLRRRRRIREESLRSLSKNTAFEGRLVQGKVLRTLVDGRTIHQADARAEVPAARPRTKAVADPVAEVKLFQK